MSDTEAGSLAEWLMSGEPPKTHEQRVWWHEYKTHDGIKEHAERIASLEELVWDMRTCIAHACMCEFCPLFASEDMDERRCIADVKARMRELGLEVE